jgi:tRNA(Arg) A34 adenosine deaminase TadA
MTQKRFNMTAIIYDKRGMVLSVGKNSYEKTHPLQADHARRAGEPEKYFLHAEISAIIKLRGNKKAHSISVFRFKEDGSPALAKPCAICALALKEANIKIIRHT